MKYALAITNKLIEVYSSDIMLGYDIGCEFSVTLANSSVGKRATQAGLRCIVPSFHGHSHNRGCQVNWHPRYVEGAGIEDFEGCERFFHRSNDQAPGTRLATPFHRHQAIAQHVMFWGEDKHAESGEFRIFLSTFRNLLIYSQETSSMGTTSRRLRSSETTPWHSTFSPGSSRFQVQTVNGSSSKSARSS